MVLFWNHGDTRRVELMGGPRDGDHPVLRATDTGITVGHAAGDVEITGHYLPREGHPHRLFWKADNVPSAEE